MNIREAHLYVFVFRQFIVAKMNARTDETAAQSEMFFIILSFLISLMLVIGFEKNVFAECSFFWDSTFSIIMEEFTG